MHPGGDLYSGVAIIDGCKSSGLCTGCCTWDSSIRGVPTDHHTPLALRDVPLTTGQHPPLLLAGLRAIPPQECEFIKRVPPGCNESGIECNQSRLECNSAEFSCSCPTKNPRDLYNIVVILSIPLFFRGLGRYQKLGFSN